MLKNNRNISVLIGNDILPYSQNDNQNLALLDTLQEIHNNEGQSIFLLTDYTYGTFQKYRYNLQRLGYSFPITIMQQGFNASSREDWNSITESNDLTRSIVITKDADIIANAKNNMIPTINADNRSAHEVAGDLKATYQHLAFNQ